MKYLNYININRIRAKSCRNCNPIRDLAAMHRGTITLYGYENNITDRRMDGTVLKETIFVPLVTLILSSLRVRVICMYVLKQSN